VAGPPSVPAPLRTVADVVLLALLLHEDSRDRVRAASRPPRDRVPAVAGPPHGRH
jgi:hypothetical protein